MEVNQMVLHLPFSSFFIFLILTLRIISWSNICYYLGFLSDSSNLKQRKTNLHYMDDGYSLTVLCSTNNFQDVQIMSEAKFTLKCIVKTIPNITKALLLHKNPGGHSSWKFGQGCTAKAFKPQPACITDETKLLLRPSAKQH